MECKTHPAAQECILKNNDRRVKSENYPTRSDINKLLSFSENPEKYATGTSKAREKAQYLESIKYKFSEGQLATYTTARNIYDAAVKLKNETIISKIDYSGILADALNNHKTVKIRYKGSWRTIDPYSLDKTYVVGYCHLACDIRTFRVDRIQGAELLGSFSADGSLQRMSQSKLKDAPSYKRYGGYRRRY